MSSDSESISGIDFGEIIKLLEMKGDVRLHSISVIGAYLPFFEEVRN